MTRNYDLAIIGMGAAGLIAASLAKEMGARVALLEKDKIGGDCTWTGCVPSKTLLKTAKVAHMMRTAGKYGLPPTDPKIDIKSVLGHVQDVISVIYQHTTPESLQSRGVDFYQGEAHFLDMHRLSLGEEELRANYIVLCTGAQPAIPPIPGLESVKYLTYLNVWELNSMPAHLVVVGGGNIGCEMAQAFARLGSQVTLLEATPRILPRDDASAALALADVFRKEGINIRFGAEISKVWQNQDKAYLLVGEREIVADALLVATGRHPNVEGLDLEKAGVSYSRFGIKVDQYLRTSQRHIYAAGDCTGGYQFSHYAAWQAFIAVRNALLPGKTKGITEAVPWTTFTDPEVAQVGLTEDRARQRFNDKVLTYEWPMSRTDRAQNEAATEGFLKLVYLKNGKLLGATIVAAQAGEMINEWVLILKKGWKIGKLAGVIHVYPTYSVVNMKAAADIMMERLLSGFIGRLIRRLARVQYGKGMVNG